MWRAPSARVKSSWSSKTLLLESSGAADTCFGRALEALEALTVDDVFPNNSKPLALDAEEGEEEMVVSEEEEMSGGGKLLLLRALSLRGGELGSVVGWRTAVLSRVEAGDRGRVGFSRAGSV